MFKKIKIIIVSLVLLVSSSASIFAEDENSFVIYQNDGYEIKEVIESDLSYKLYTYEDGELLYISYYKDDGNLYMNVEGNEILAMEIIDEYQEDYSFITSKAIKRAPSKFLLTNSGYVQRIVINWDVISIGSDAIASVIIGFVIDKFNVKNLTTKVISVAIVQSLAVFIKNNYTTYDTNVTRNSYVYNGCNWLLYNEFVYPGGYTVGAYAWTDNPSLGIASSVCKLASQSYPY